MHAGLEAKLQALGKPESPSNLRDHDALVEQQKQEIVRLKGQLATSESGPHSDSLVPGKANQELVALQEELEEVQLAAEQVCMSPPGMLILARPSSRMNRHAPRLPTR